MLSEHYYFIKLNESKEIKVDKCIGKEVEELIKKGVVIYGCCCGHGEAKPNCLVDIKSKVLLNELGYKLIEYTPLHSTQGIFQIELKERKYNVG